MKKRIASIALSAVLAASALPALTLDSSAGWVKTNSGYTYNNTKQVKILLDGRKLMAVNITLAQT